MAMTLVWNDAKSFKQHLEHMRMFHQSHHGDMEGGFASLKDMPTPCDICPLSNEGGCKSFISARGRQVLVPLWEVELPSNLQN
jgi:hypothetical protein